MIGLGSSNSDGRLSESWSGADGGTILRSGYVEKSGVIAVGAMMDRLWCCRLISSLVLRGGGLGETRPMSTPQSLETRQNSSSSPTGYAKASRERHDLCTKRAYYLKVPVQKGVLVFTRICNLLGFAISKT